MYSKVKKKKVYGSVCVCIYVFVCGCLYIDTVCMYTVFTVYA